MEQIIIKNLWKSYDSLTVLKNVDLTLDRDQTYCLMSPSGTGKTTLFRILMGLEKADEGEIVWNASSSSGFGSDRDVSRPLRISTVFQEDRLCPQLNAIQNVELVLPEGKTKYREQIHNDFLQIGLDEAALSLPARKLSGGQKRRAALLRALWAESDTLLLDEPFTGMDPDTMKKAAALLKERCGEKVVLLATHDQEAIQELGWRVMEL